MSGTAPTPAVPPAIVPTEAETKLIRAAAAGVACRFDTDTRPAKATNGARWGDGRTIRAEVLGALLTGERDDWPVHRLGVQVSGAKITGQLDLSYARITGPVRLQRCWFSNAPDLTHLTAVTLDFEGSRLPGLKGNNLVAAGDLILQQTQVEGETSLIDARLGRLMCRGADLQNAGGNALTMDGAEVAGTVFLDTLVHEGKAHRFTTTGAVRILNAKLGSLDCTGANLRNAGGVALAMDRAEITGSVFLKLFVQDGHAHRFTAQGEVRMLGAKLAGLACHGADLQNAGGVALGMDRAEIAGDVFLQTVTAGGQVHRFTAQGEVRLVAARLGGLECQGADLRNVDGNALSLSDAEVTGNVLLNAVSHEGIAYRFSTQGVVRMLGAKVGGLECRGAELRNADGLALAMDGAEVTRTVFLSTFFHNGPAERFTAQGDARMPAATLGRMECEGDFQGNFIAFGAAVRESLHLKDCTFTRLLDLERVTVAGTLDLQVRSAPGSIDLRNAHVGRMDDVEGSWPTAAGAVILDGFRYDALGQPWSAASRIRWLERHTGDGAGFRMQPYQQLAAYYESIGHSQDAQDVRVALERARRSHGGMARGARLWSWLLDQTIRYGYSMRRPKLALVAFLLVGAVMFQLADDPVMRRSKPNDESQQFFGPTYSMDTFFPIVDFGQESQYHPDAGATWELWGPSRCLAKWCSSTCGCTRRLAGS